MIDEKIVNILIERIQNAKINPVTSQPFKVADIKIEIYRVAVTESLNQPNAAE